MALTEIKQAGLDDEAVNESKLQISNAGTNGQYLQKSSNTGGLTWADVPASVGGATGVDFNDGILVRWGTGNDFVINHIAGSYTQLDDATDSAVFFTTDNTTTGWQFRKRTGSVKCVEIYPDAGVHLYHNSNQKLVTTATGITVTGTVAATALTGDGSALTGVSSSSADGTMWKNTLTISNDHTIAANEGAHSVGPITNNATVTVNGRWVIS